MKHLFLDTNILIDFIADRKPFSKFATLFFQQAEQKKIRLYASALSIANMHYILLKFIKEDELRVLLMNLCSYLSILPLTAEVLQKSLRSKHKDFEDNLQLIIAEENKNIEVIVTRNVKDFKGAGLPVMAPEEAWQKLQGS